MYLICSILYIISGGEHIHTINTHIFAFMKLRSMRLRVLMSDNGKTVTDVAKALGITYQGLYKKLKKPENINIKEIEIISNCLGVDSTEVARCVFKD